MVELPGFVGDDGAAALGALGGIEAVAAAAGGQAAYLRLALRGGTPWRTPCSATGAPRAACCCASRAPGVRALEPPCRVHTASTPYAWPPSCPGACCIADDWQAPAPAL